MRERRVLWVVLAAFVVGMIAVAGLAAVGDDSSGSGPPRLPALAMGAAGRDAAAPAASSMLAVGPVEYRVADGALDAALADHARAWTVDDRIDADSVRRVASALGVKGAPKEDDTAWTVHDDTHQVRVEKQAGAPWSYSPWMPDCGPDSSVSSDGTVSCGGASGSGSATATATLVAPPATSVEPCPMPDCPPGTACAQVCPTPSLPDPMPVPEPKEPERPADLPSKADAERLARELLARTGADLEGATVRTDDGFSQWMVAVDPVVGGLPTQGMTSTVAVGPKGAIQFANGWLGDPTEGDDYPLAGVQAAIERLKSGYPGGGWSAYPPGPEPAIARDMPVCADCPPQVRTITGVRLGLQFSPVFSDDTGLPSEALLVPAYFFRFDDSEFEQPVIAVADEFLPKPPEVKPMPAPEPSPLPAEPGGGIGNGASCQSQGSAAVDGNAPLVIDVCVDPNPAKAGEPVRFDVTYSDPDAPIPDNGCNVVDPDFENGGFASCSASCAGAPPGTPTTVAPAEPGKLAKTYTHTYENPGTYKVTFSARSGGLCDQSPHASSGQLTVEVVVRG